jgi:hypothetical protein
VFTYVVTSYTNPGQTVRLARRLRKDSPGCRIVVSHDRKMPSPESSALASADAELWLTAEDVTWGDPSYLRSLLEVIRRAALQTGDWLTILTGQDYPIRPLREYERHALTAGADMLLEEPDESDPHLSVLLRRYRLRAYPVAHWMGRHRVRQVVKHLPGIALTDEPRGLPPYLVRPRLRTPFNATFQLYKGADQLAISDRAAEVLLSASPSLLRYYEGTRHPNESYIHTVLRNDPSLVNIPGMLHFTRWGPSPHPMWLTMDDLPDLLDSGYWFARKFAQDAPVLDALDAVLDEGSAARPHPR